MREAGVGAACIAVGLIAAGMEWWQGLMTVALGNVCEQILDPDQKHGVFGAAKHGYFESSVNHDALAFLADTLALVKQ